MKDGRLNGRKAVDVHIGSRVRLRRAMLGLSQQALARTLCITFQQVQKYESGANRIAGARFFDLAAALDVPVSYFFEESPEPGGSSEDEPGTWMLNRETIELARAYHAIANESTRRCIRDLVRAIALSEQAAVSPRVEPVSRAAAPIAASNRIGKRSGTI